MTLRKVCLRLALLPVPFLAGCATSQPQSQHASEVPAPAPVIASKAPAASEKPQPTYGSFGFDSSGMDRATAPGDNFYTYANGAWAERTTIPADRTGYGMFNALTDEAEKRTRGLIEDAAKQNAPEGTDTRKLGDLYNSYMDEAAIEAKGLSPIQPELARIQALKSVSDLSKYLGDSLRADVDALNTGNVDTDRFFGMWITPDLNDPSHYMPYLLQGGLGLPDRDYYLVDNPRFKEIRAKYVAHIARMLTLAKLASNDAQAKAKAKKIFDLEHRIAEAHWSQVDTQDVARTNNPWARSEFSKKAPGMDWDAFFQAASLGDQKTIGVWQPSALTGMSRLVKSQKLDQWKDYLTFRVLARNAWVLPKAFDEESFAFNGKVLSGVEQQRPRWKRAISFTELAMDQAVGHLYVQKYFPPEAKAQADAMVKNILAALGRHIDSLSWMSPETKQKAKEKLAAFRVGIGNPNTWIDFSSLEVKRDDAYGNVERAGRFETRRQLAKLGQPVDRDEWFMSPQLVNALNSPQLNSIIFPAAILQPPFFDPNADPAVNYGGIGAVIGHEISHGFDDVGAQFDGTGKLANWWTPSDLEQFRAAGKALAEQYSSYQPLPDAHINGELTLGENIADVAGLAIAHDAWVASLNGKPAETIDGFTPDQRFFLGFAQVWRGKMREAAMRRLILTNGHSPAEFRALTVRNQDAWYSAFDVKPDQALFLAPGKRVKIW